MTDLAQIYAEILALRRTLEEQFQVIRTLCERIDHMTERLGGAQEVFDREFHRGETK